MTSNQFFRNLWIKPQISIYKNQNKLFSIKTETDLTCEKFQGFSNLKIHTCIWLNFADILRDLFGFSGQDRQLRLGLPVKYNTNAIMNP